MSVFMKSSTFIGVSVARFRDSAIFKRGFIFLTDKDDMVMNPIFRLSMISRAI